MASIVKVSRKRGTGYQAVVRRKGHKPIKRTFDRKSEAKRWADEQEALIGAMRYRDPRLAEMVSLGEALEKYRKEGFQMDKAASTMEREKYSRKHLERLIGEETALGRIDSSLVNDYQTTRLEEGASNSSIRQELAMLSKMFNRARRVWNLPVSNPVDDIERVPPARGRDRFLSTEEAALVIAQARISRNDRFYPYVLMLMHTGMRSSEAAKLNENQVNLAGQYVVVKNTKSGRPRNIPLTSQVTRLLENVKKENGYFFLREKHFGNERTMMRPGEIFRECWANLWKRLNKSNPEIPYFTPHDIRHTAGSHLLMAGVDVRIIADILGHSTLQMVMRYTHLSDSHRQEIVAKIGYLGEEKIQLSPDDESFISSGL